MKPHPPDPGDAGNHFWMVSQDREQRAGDRSSLEFMDEFRDSFCGLPWFPLKDQVRAVDFRHANFRIDAPNLVQTRLWNQFVLCRLDVKERHSYLAQCLSCVA